MALKDLKRIVSMAQLGRQDVTTANAARYSGQPQNIAPAATLK